MEVCLRHLVSWSFTNNDHQADNERSEEIEKPWKIESKTIVIVYKSLCLCVCVGYSCVLLCVDM